MRAFRSASLKGWAYALSHQEEIVDLIRRKYSTEKSRNHGLQWSSGIEQPRGEHSAQPEAGPELIESYFPNLPKIELNRRGPHGRAGRRGQ